MSDSKTGNALSKNRRVHVALALAGVIGAVGLAGPMLTSASTPALAAVEARTFQYAPTQFAELVEEVKPSVVTILTEGKERSPHRSSRSGPQAPDLPKGHPKGDLFKKFGGKPGGPEGHGKRSPRGSSQGSGFFVTADGFVVTNNHVIDGGLEIKIKTTDGKTYPAKLIGSDPKTDLALLKVDTDRKFVPVKFAEKSARVGDWVVAVGNPFGLGGSVTSGIVSALGREIGSGPYDDFLQIDAAINRGNSGGPAFNLDGDVVGVNTAIFSPSGGSVGIGFAIPTKMVERVIADLKDDGKVTRGWLGVSIQPLSEDLAENLGLETVEGAIVTSVSEDSPADRAGLETGDTILDLNGGTIRDPRDLARKVAALKPGSDAKLQILRDGKEVSETVKIGLLPGSDKLASSFDRKKARASLASLGLSLAPGDGSNADDDGVVIAKVDPDGPAGRKGIRPGDRIIEVAGKPVVTVRDVRQRLGAMHDKGRKSVLFLVRSQSDRQRFVALPLKDA